MKQLLPLLILQFFGPKLGKICGKNTQSIKVINKKNTSKKKYFQHPLHNEVFVPFGLRKNISN